MSAAPQLAERLAVGTDSDTFSGRDPRVGGAAASGYRPRCYQSQQQCRAGDHFRCPRVVLCLLCHPGIHAVTWPLTAAAWRFSATSIVGRSYSRRVDRDQIHAAIALERRRIADLIDSLDEAQLATESLCTGWDVNTVAAHLASALADGTVRPMPVAMLRTLRLGLRRGSLTRVVDERARRRAQVPAAEIAATLRDLADHQYWYPPPQAASARLAEVLPHSGDIRIPLGLPFQPDPQLTATALDFLTGPWALGLVPWGRLRGLRLHATDIDRTWGKGQEIRGRAAELLMAAFGRTAVLDALDGPGLALLRQRISG
jgi:uncharacterized protein (TIGR03083 family)